MRRVVASAIVCGLLFGGLASYTACIFMLPLAPRCEPDTKMKVMGRCEGGICEFSVEKCEDGTMTLRPSAFIPMDDAPTSFPDMDSPKTEA